MIKKITSRKFIVTLLSAIAGIVTLCVGDSEIVTIITGAAMTIIPTIVYCFVEGKIDAESVKTLVDVTVDTAEKLGANEETVEAIEKIGAVGEVLVEDPVE